MKNIQLQEIFHTILSNVKGFLKLLCYSLIFFYFLRLIGNSSMQNLIPLFNSQSFTKVLSYQMTSLLVQKGRGLSNDNFSIHEDYPMESYERIISQLLVSKKQILIYSFIWAIRSLQCCLQSESFLNVDFENICQLQSSISLTFGRLKTIKVLCSNRRVLNQIFTP